MAFLNIYAQDITFLLDKSPMFVGGRQLVPVGREQSSFTKEELLESITTTKVEEVSSCVFLKIHSFLLLEMEAIEHS